MHSVAHTIATASLASGSPATPAPATAEAVSEAAVDPYMDIYAALEEVVDRDMLAGRACGFDK